MIIDEYDRTAQSLLLKSNSTTSWSEGQLSELLRSFYATIKSFLNKRGSITNVYITGVMPLLLNETLSDFNVVSNISHNYQYAELCGLSQSDAFGTLKTICSNHSEAESHLAELTRYVNGYHFCSDRKVEPMYNTTTCLGYFNVSLPSFFISMSSNPAAGHSYKGRLPNQGPPQLRGFT